MESAETPQEMTGVFDKHRMVNYLRIILKKFNYV
jgi:hypothetical protein